MEKIDGTIQHDCVSYKEFPEHVNEIVTMKGMIHRIREMTGFAFVIIRTAREVVQCVYSPDFSDYRMDEKVVEGCAVKLTGKIVKDETREGRYEMQIHNIEVLSTPAEMMPIVINKKQLDNIPLDLNLNMRPVTLRNPKERAVFKIQEGIARGFREFLFSQNFTEIRTPKINAQGAEGGANIFKLDYFGKQVFLAQSPQFYKQMLVPVYERVFEVGPVFRAEHHDTSRHLNEYISMDFEMGFIDSFYDIMNMETGALKYIMALLKKDYAEEIALLNVNLPEIVDIPFIKFMDAKEIITKKFKKKITDYRDFEPEEEQLLGFRLPVRHPLPVRKAPVLRDGRPRRPELYVEFRPPVPRHRDHHGRSAHSRLQRADHQDEGARHEPRRFRELSHGAQVRHASARRLGSRVGAHHHAPARIQERAQRLHVPARHQPRHPVIKSLHRRRRCCPFCSRTKGRFAPAVRGNTIKKHNCQPSSKIWLTIFLWSGKS